MAIHLKMPYYQRNQNNPPPNQESNSLLHIPFSALLVRQGSVKFDTPFFFLNLDLSGVQKKEH